jgi:hypothetical protein
MGKRPEGVTIERHGENVHVVTIDGLTNGGTFPVLLRGDAHHDNIHCDHKLERRHLEQVEKRGGLWLDVGDLFCAMGGKWDTRSQMHHIRPEYRCAENYLDSLVEHASEFYAPFASRCILIGRGNHETAIERKHHTDLTERLCERLSAASGVRVIPGGYGGFVVFVFRLPGKPKSTVRHTLHYYHGHGGGGMMTMGTLAIRREASFIAADTYVSGHIHEQWGNTQIRAEVAFNPACGYHVVQRRCKHIRVGTYKDEFGNRSGRGASSYHVESGRPPKPLGAMWLHLRLDRNRTDGENTFGITATTEEAH